jgi:hypothetical protein
MARAAPNLQRAGARSQIGTLYIVQNGGLALPIDDTLKVGAPIDSVPVGRCRVEVRGDVSLNAFVAEGVGRWTLRVMLTIPLNQCQRRQS